MDEDRTNGPWSAGFDRSTGPDRRGLLINELWDDIRVMVEESELDEARKDELILDLGQCEARRVESCVVSLRSLPPGRDSEESIRED